MFSIYFRLRTMLLTAEWPGNWATFHYIFLLDFFNFQIPLHLQIQDFQKFKFVYSLDTFLYKTSVTPLEKLYSASENIVLIQGCQKTNIQFMYTAVLRYTSSCNTSFTNRKILQLFHHPVLYICLLYTSTLLYVIQLCFRLVDIFIACEQFLFDWL